MSKNLIFTKGQEIVHSAYTVKDDSIKILNVNSVILKQAFKNDATQECVLMTANVSSIGESALENCKELQIVEFTDKTECILCNGEENKINLANSNFDLTVQYHAFKNCEKLHTVVFPAMQKHKLTIEKEAFLGCKELRTVVIPNGEANIDGEAFKGCDTEKLVFVIKSDVANCSVERFAREYGFQCVTADNIL